MRGGGGGGGGGEGGTGEGGGGGAMGHPAAAVADLSGRFEFRGDEKRPLSVGRLPMGRGEKLPRPRSAVGRVETALHHGKVKIEGRGRGRGGGGVCAFGHACF